MVLLYSQQKEGNEKRDEVQRQWQEISSVCPLWHQVLHQTCVRVRYSGCVTGPPSPQEACAQLWRDNLTWQQKARNYPPSVAEFLPHTPHARKCPCKFAYMPAFWHRWETLQTSLWDLNLQPKFKRHNEWCASPGWVPQNSFHSRTQYESFFVVVVDFAWFFGSPPPPKMLKQRPDVGTNAMHKYIMKRLEIGISCFLLWELLVFHPFLHIEIYSFPLFESLVLASWASGNWEWTEPACAYGFLPVMMSDSVSEKLDFHHPWTQTSTGDSTLMTRWPFFKKKKMFKLDFPQCSDHGCTCARFHMWYNSIFFFFFFAAGVLPVLFFLSPGSHGTEERKKDRSV